MINSLYRRLVYPLGKRYLQRALSNGLPPEWTVPLGFLLTGRLNSGAQNVASQVETIRTQLAHQPNAYTFQTIASDLGAQNFVRIVAAATPGTPSKSPRLTSRWIANVASVSAYWGMFLYLAATATQAKQILELGSCAGISGCYLSSAPGCQQFITIEGSPALAGVAQATIRQVNQNATIINALFDSGLDQVLPTLQNKLDFVFIDGHHELEATRHYFERLKTYLSPKAILVFDDIRLYHSMWEFWQQLSQQPGFSHLINVGRFGVGVWNSLAPQPLEYDFSPYTGLWKIGGRRSEAATFNSQRT